MSIKLFEFDKEVDLSLVFNTKSVGITFSPLASFTSWPDWGVIVSFWAVFVFGLGSEAVNFNVNTSVMIFCASADSGAVAKKLTVALTIDDRLRPGLIDRC